MHMHAQYASQATTQRADPNLTLTMTLSLHPHPNLYPSPRVCMCATYMHVHVCCTPPRRPTRHVHACACVLYASQATNTTPARVPSHFMRPPKPSQRDRLNLNRYDEQDFQEVVAGLKDEGAWLL